MNLLKSSRLKNLHKSTRPVTTSTMTTPQSKGGVMRAKHTIENGNPMSKIPGKIDISSSRPPKCSWGKDKAPTSAGFDGSQQSYSPQAGPTTGGFPGTTRQSTWR
ncbi:hypothetical protein OCU04_012966 [Sclerotinia nivalis]|uniref:Uncharacterized protein n=1 Tax=Sclerotinia nivalis TaxID=352851 RepID=A0A9X0AC23_9HELO|nr:hypothetical protein OCU04_012966 [Sclerotinia nivalis]